MTREEQLEEALKKSEDLNRALLGVMLHGFVPSLQTIKGVAIFLDKQEALSVEERKTLLSAMIAKIDHLKTLVFETIEAAKEGVNG